MGIGNNPNKMFWTSDLPATEAEWRGGAAVQNNWNGNGGYVQSNPAGLRGFIGKAAPQLSSDGTHVLPGGGEQIWIPQGTATPGSPMPTPWSKSMPRIEAEQLRDSLNGLLAILAAWTARETDPAQVQSLNASRDLVEVELTRLRRLIAGLSPLPEQNVYLSVSSLNKGLAEIGANCLQDSRLRELIGQVTARAYQLYKQTRP